MDTCVGLDISPSLDSLMSVFRLQRLSWAAYVNDNIVVFVTIVAE